MYTSGVVVSIGPRPNYDGGNLNGNGSFIFTVGITVHTNLDRKQSFLKMLFKPNDLKTGSILETELFSKRWRHDNHVISLTQFSSNTNPKWPLIAAFSNFSVVGWTVNKLMSFLMRLSCYWSWIPPYNIVKIAVDPRGDGRVDPQTALTMLWRNSLSVTGQTHLKLTSICFGDYF